MSAPELSAQERITQILALTEPPADDVSTETSPDPEAEPDPDEEAPEAEANAQVEGADAEESEMVRTFSELAQQLEIEEEALAKHLRVQGRNGEEVSLHDVLTDYRAPRPEAAEIERDRAALAQLRAKEAEISTVAEQLRQTAQAFAQQLRGQEPDWAALKTADPVQYATARLEWMEKVRQLEIADQQYRTVRAQQQAAEQQKIQEFRTQEARKLQAAVPEWKDPKAFEAGLEKVERWLMTQGLKPEELANLSDSRDWLVARKAMLYDELQAKKPVVKEKLKSLPRMLPPGATSGADRGASAKAAKEEAEMFARLKEHGRPEDAAALITRHIERQDRATAARTLRTGRRS